MAAGIHTNHDDKIGTIAKNPERNEKTHTIVNSAYLFQQNTRF